MGARLALCGAACAAISSLSSMPAYGWGDEGHEVIGLIADHYLESKVRDRVNALLAGDASRLTDLDFAHESTWADKYRDSDRGGAKLRYRQTRAWHYVDLELEGADLKSACFGIPKLPPAVPASAGPADDCVVHKIEEFAAELAAPAAPEPERRLALQFLLHLVGDVHQPLHAGDDHDRGGNLKIVMAPGAGRNNLHHDWDTVFVGRLGGNAHEIAPHLIGEITAAQRARWAAGSAADWAFESYSIAKAHTYGLLGPPSGPGRYELSAAYVADATAVTAEQLSKAGVRLAFLLNRALQ
jgi:S1/P1 Nuclease